MRQRKNRIKSGTFNPETGKYFICYQNGGKPYWGPLAVLDKKRSKAKEYNRIFRAENGDLVRARLKQYYRDNPEKFRIWARNNRAKRTEVGKLAARMRSRISHAVKAFDARWSWSSTKNLIGCDFKFLKQYIESKFLPGMSWENRKAWHIDHKIPVAFAKTPEVLTELFHYTNLEPIWAQDNLKKGRHFMITGKVDVTKIDKSKLFKGAKGTYLDIVLIETPNSQYGDYMIAQSVTKEERLAGVKGAILGNAKIIGGKTATPPAPREDSSQPRYAAPKPAAPANDGFGDDDSIPF